MTDILDLTPLRNAISSLRNAWRIVQTRDWFEQQSAEVQETLVAGVIQNYEFVYELSYKMLVRKLEIHSGDGLEIRRLNFRDIIRIAGESGLIDEVTNWFGYRELRNLTSHTYDHMKAQHVLSKIEVFITDATDLFERLSA